MKLDCLLLVLAVSLTLLVAADRCAPLPPDNHLREATAHGCVIQQEPYPDTHWYVRVWSRIHKKPEWQSLYSIRQADEVRRALLDCDTWLDCVKRAEVEARKEAAPWPKAR